MCRCPAGTSYPSLSFDLANGHARRQPQLSLNNVSQVSAHQMTTPLLVHRTGSRRSRSVGVGLVRAVATAFILFAKIGYFGFILVYSEHALPDMYTVRTRCGCKGVPPVAERRPLTRPAVQVAGSRLTCYSYRKLVKYRRFILWTVHVRRTQHETRRASCAPGSHDRVRAGARRSPQ